MAEKSNSIIDFKDIKKLLRAVIVNWHVILASIVISSTFAYIYIYKQPKIYAAKTQLLLKSDETYPIDKGLFTGLYDQSYYGYEKLSNQKRVLTSTDLIAQVVSKLKLNITYYIVGRIQTKEVYGGTPFHVEATIYNPAFYDFPFTLKIINTEKYEISYESNGKNISVKKTMRAIISYYWSPFFID